MRKIFVLVVVIVGWLSPTYTAGNKYYKKESVKVIIADVSAKVSTLKTLVDRPPEWSYSVKNLFDGNKASAWCTKFNKEDENMSVSDEGFLKIYFQKPVYIKSIKIWNGYQKTKELYNANHRVKDLYIEKVLAGGRTYPLDNKVQLKDSMDAQEISMSEGWTQSINLFRTKELIFDILDIYSGSKYDDLCISEMQINISKDINYFPSITWQDLKKLIDAGRIKNNSGWSWSGLNEDSYRLFNDLLYYVLTGNKEAYFYFDSYRPAGSGDSEAMKNIFRPAVSAELKLSHK